LYGEGIIVEKDQAQRKSGVSRVKDVIFWVFMVFIIALIFVTVVTRLQGGEPQLFGYRLYVVESGSMGPTIKPNSLIVVKELEPSQIKEMDIITFYGSSGETTVTHRVVEIKDNGLSFVTKGDANEVPDPMPVEANRLIGKVVLAIPYLGKVLKFLSTPLGLTLLIVFAVVWAIFDSFVGKL